MHRFGLMVLLLSCNTTQKSPDTRGSVSSQDIVFNFDLPPSPDLGPSADTLTDPGPCAGLSDGDPCDDGNKCTLNDRCTGGFCVPERALVCPETGDPCRQSICEPALGCVEFQSPESAPCEAPCYQGAQCIGGSCIPEVGTEIACSAPTDPCVDAIGCDPGTGTCTQPLYRLACPAGSVCRAESVGEGEQLSCAQAFSMLCRPCREDAECLEADFPSQVNACISFGAKGSFCGGACAVDGTGPSCPEGYSCEPVDTAAGTQLQCVPHQGASCSCDASWSSLAYTTDCYRENQYGKCDGQRGCAPGGLTACDAPTPGPEVCDNKDNDCDGQVDEIPGEGCGPLGACCLAEGGCIQLYQYSCISSGGNFSGPGLACSEVSCGGGATGACCVPGGCADVPAALCGASDGWYVGDTSSCSTADCSSPPPTGACCRFDGGCEVLTLGECGVSGGTWSGAGTGCAIDSCPLQGSCCWPDGSCVETPGALCEKQSGFWSEGLPCAKTGCFLEPGSGACCSELGSCEVLSEENCSGQFLVGEACVGQCNAPVLGACCGALEGCLLLPLADCPAGSTWKGAETTCASCEQEEGICCANDKCYPGLTEAQCAAVSGQYQGPDATCESCL